MFEVNNPSENCIRLTRGDTARLSVPIDNELTNTKYTLASGDILTLTLKKRETDSEPLMQKVVTGTNQFHILPSDTADIPFGKYVYDVELKTATGDVYTVIVPTSFEILKEVTY